jgi:hypothetical protein
MKIDQLNAFTVVNIVTSFIMLLFAYVISSSSSLIHVTNSMMRDTIVTMINNISNAFMWIGLGLLIMVAFANIIMRIDNYSNNKIVNSQSSKIKQIRELTDNEDN